MESLQLPVACPLKALGQVSQKIESVSGLGEGRTQLRKERLEVSLRFIFFPMEAPWFLLAASPLVLGVFCT